MRGSKAQKLRRMTRAFNAHLTADKIFLEKKKVVMTPKNHIPIPGMPTPTAIFLGQHKMNRNCFRHAYKGYKKMYKMATSKERVMNDFR